MQCLACANFTFKEVTKDRKAQGLGRCKLEKSQYVYWKAVIEHDCAKFERAEDEAERMAYMDGLR